MATTFFLMYRTPFSSNHASLLTADFGFTISHTATGLRYFAYRKTSMAKRATPIFAAHQYWIYGIGLGAFLGVVSTGNFMGDDLGRCYADGISGN